MFRLLTITLLGLSTYLVQNAQADHEIPYDGLSEAIVNSHKIPWKPRDNGTARTPKRLCTRLETKEEFIDFQEKFNNDGDRKRTMQEKFNDLSTAEANLIQQMFVMNIGGAGPVSPKSSKELGKWVTQLVQDLGYTFDVGRGLLNETASVLEKFENKVIGNHTATVEERLELNLKLRRYLDRLNLLWVNVMNNNSLAGEAKRIAENLIVKYPQDAFAKKASGFTLGTQFVAFKQDSTEDLYNGLAHARRCLEGLGPEVNSVARNEAELLKKKYELAVREREFQEFGTNKNLILEVLAAGPAKMQKKEIFTKILQALDSDANFKELLNVPKPSAFTESEKETVAKLSALARIPLPPGKKYIDILGLFQTGTNAQIQERVGKIFGTDKVALNLFAEAADKFKWGLHAKAARALMEINPSVVTEGAAPATTAAATSTTTVKEEGPPPPPHHDRYVPPTSMVLSTSPAPKPVARRAEPPVLKRPRTSYRDPYYSKREKRIRELKARQQRLN